MTPTVTEVIKTALSHREAGAHATTPTYTVRRDGPAREPSWSAFWLQNPSILRLCVREEDARGREAGHWT